MTAFREPQPGQACRQRYSQGFHRCTLAGRGPPPLCWGPKAIRLAKIKSCGGRWMASRTNASHPIGRVDTQGGLCQTMKSCWRSALLRNPQLHWCSPNPLPRILLTLRVNKLPSFTAGVGSHALVWSVDGHLSPLLAVAGLSQTAGKLFAGMRVAKGPLFGDRW